MLPSRSGTVPDLPYFDWLIDTGQRLKTTCGRQVAVWELSPKQDDGVLSGWARHFREHYCLDSQIDILRIGTGYTKEEYLLKLKFPDPCEGFGPGTRSGDFAEILISDYVQFRLKYEVPRERYRGKWIPNESTKGADVVGYLFNQSNPRKDELVTFEVKALLSQNKNTALERLQVAIDGSAADEIRLGFSLNAFKQLAINLGDMEQMKRIARFQNLADNPFIRKYGAALVVDNTSFADQAVLEASADKHPFKTALTIIVVKGNALMAFTHQLYARAAAEA